MSTAIKTQGFHHIGLTVPNLGQAKEFFIDLLGFNLLGEMPDYPAFYASDDTAIISIWQAKEPAQAVAFNRHENLGLHHLALAVADNQALAALYQALAASPLVDIEFAPEPLSGGEVHHLMCLLGGQLRIEFTALAA